ncbi:hypothetical protein phiOC_p186 [Ochrobactrum phage vB_OspM_OC]|nr:hypothetical protein phiOC_p186 [Ochrobactrum phage vB_OspM_OC]
MTEKYVKMEFDADDEAMNSLDTIASIKKISREGAACLAISTFVENENPELVSKKRPVAEVFKENIEKWKASEEPIQVSDIIDRLEYFQQFINTEIEIIDYANR